MIAPAYHFIVTVGHVTKQFETATEAAEFYDQQIKQGKDATWARARGSLPKYEDRKPKGDD